MMFCKSQLLRCYSHSIISSYYPPSKSAFCNELVVSMCHQDDHIIYACILQIELLNSPNSAKVRLFHAFSRTVVRCPLQYCPFGLYTARFFCRDPASSPLTATRTGCSFPAVEEHTWRNILQDARGQYRIGYFPYIFYGSRMTWRKHTQIPRNICCKEVSSKLGNAPMRVTTRGNWWLNNAFRRGELVVIFS